MFQSVFDDVTGLQVCYFIKKRFLQRCFSMNILKFFEKFILNKICERLLLNNEYFSTFVGKYFYRSVLFNKYSCSMQPKPILIQKEVLALVFSWLLSEIFNNNSFKEKKKHCYKKRGSDIYRKSNCATFYLTSLDFCISAQFIVTMGDTMVIHSFISQKRSRK